MQHPVRHMLRCHTKLSADMIFAKLPDKGIILILHHIIKTDPGPDKNLFNSRQSTELSQKSQIVRMIHDQILAWLRKQALLVGTYTMR